VTGCIKGKDVLANSVTIVREFGAGCYLRCLKALLLRQRRTFLDCAFRSKK
jgi:hypothetical protein